MPTKRRTRKSKQKSHGAGYQVYKDGKITNFNHNVLNFFRKYGASNVEHEIAKILKNNPHPNIVKIYNVTDEYINIEKVTPLSGMDESNREEIISAAKSAKKHLQSLNIMYIDWKPDNMGMSDDGKYKLFDFDTSGITKSNKTSWNIEPNHYWSYMQAIDAGRKTPIGIDNFAFSLSFKD